MLKHGISCFLSNGQCFSVNLCEAFGSGQRAYMLRKLLHCVCMNQCLKHASHSYLIMQVEAAWAALKMLVPRVHFMIVFLALLLLAITTNQHTQIPFLWTSLNHS